MDSSNADDVLEAVVATTLDPKRNDDDDESKDGKGEKRKGGKKQRRKGEENRNGRAGTRGEPARASVVLSSTTWPVILLTIPSDRSPSDVAVHVVGLRYSWLLRDFRYSSPLRPAAEQIPLASSADDGTAADLRPLMVTTMDDEPLLAIHPVAAAGI